LNQFSDHPVKSAVLGFMILAAMLIGLPLIGVGAAGIAFRQFLEFPPLTRYVAHAGFSWSIFILIGIVDLVLFVFLASALLHGIRKGEKKIKPAVLSPYPWWGWAGVALCLCGRCVFSDGSWHGVVLMGSSPFNDIHSFFYGSDILLS